jgi:integrase
VETRTTSRGEVHRIRYRDEGKNRALTFATRAQAERWRALLEAVGPAAALAALADPAARTVAEQVATHIEHLTGITDGTRRRYASYLRNRIEPDPIGATPITLLTRDDVAAWVNRLAAAGLAAKTIRNHHSVLSDAMRSAVRAELVPTNRAEGVRIATPDVDDHDAMVTLTQPEVWAFVAATGEHWRPMVLFLFGTGVRWQEAAALQVADVDLEARTATIRRAWKDTAGAGHQLGKPKSKRSRRTVVFGTAVARAITPLIEGRDPAAFVFTNTRGGPVRHQNFTDQAWGKALHTFAGDTARKVRGAKGRPKIVWEPGPGKRPTPHDARHTFASLAITQQRASDAFLQRQLGHESITTTINTYTHLRTEDLRPLAGTIDEPPALEAAPLPDSQEARTGDSTGE